MSLKKCSTNGCSAYYASNYWGIKKAQGSGWIIPRSENKPLCPSHAAKK